MKHLKDLKKYLVPFIIFILFYDLIVKLYDKYIIKTVLVKLNKNILTEIIFYSTIAYIIYNTIFKVKKGYFIKDSQVVLSVFLALLYGYFRISFNEQFLSLNSLNFLKYADIILVALLSVVGLKFFACSNNNNNNKRIKIIENDDPIETIQEDLLNRSYIAKRLFNEINSIDSKNSIAIGISSKWGNGKTSFMNMVKELYEKEENKIIIDFNPWLNFSLKSIVQDFFDTIENSIKDYSLDISKEMNSYSKKILKVEKSNYIESLFEIINPIDEKTQQENFHELNSLLKELNKKIIIFIDDLDRLHSDEIFEILKLIRNTANFDCFNYIVAYDKKYLVESLSSLVPIAEKFSEKIFLKEVNLLPVEKRIIREMIRKRLLVHAPDKTEEINSFFIHELEDRLLNRFSELMSGLKNLRDTKRFLNSFLNDYNEIKNDVQFRDYFSIKLLKFCFYDVYMLLYNYRYSYLAKGDKYNDTEHYYLKRKNNDSRDDDLFFDSYSNSVLEEDIKELYDYNEEQLKDLRVILNFLFSKFISLRNRLSITYEHNYYKYFRDIIDVKQISIDDFQKTLNLPLEEIKSKIDVWESEDRLDYAKILFEDTEKKSLKNREQFENYIRSIVYLGNKVKKDRRDGKFYVGYNFNTFYNLINNTLGDLTERYYDDKSEIKSFILSVLEEAKHPYNFESNLCHFLEEKIANSTDVINKTDTRKFLIKYFDKYCEKFIGEDSDFWNLFHNNKITTYTRQGNAYRGTSEFQKEAKEIFKKTLKEHLDYFLVAMINTQPFYNGTKSDGKVSISDLIAEVFGSYEDFVTFLEQIDIEKSNSEFLKEFLDFAKAYVLEKEYIYYEFTYPPMIKKLKDIVKRSQK